MLNFFSGTSKVVEEDWQKAARSVGLTQAELHTLWVIYFEGRVHLSQQLQIMIGGSFNSYVVKRLKEKV
ncbi:hypothetical protein KHA80_02530 [Anaerobacillus sp. HL2]|nr:hypothetical protein KHA80_02530 [Anaerobacillus sp. HL2]